MKDLVKEAIGRTLGVSSNLIVSWSLSAVMGRGCSLRNTLQVKVAADRAALQRLQSGERRGSWALDQMAVTCATQVPDYGLADIDVALLYGKETQHIFKALAQQTVYRRNQKSKRK